MAVYCTIPDGGTGKMRTPIALRCLLPPSARDSQEIRIPEMRSLCGFDTFNRNRRRGLRLVVPARGEINHNSRNNDQRPE
jgi:hypothetical protein